MCVSSFIFSFRSTNDNGVDDDDDDSTGSLFSYAVSYKYDNPRCLDQQ